MGICDAVSSLGVADFNIDDYPGVVAWASCPQKGVLSLPLTYAPVSFTDKAIEMVKKRGCRSYVHHPILDARHWGIIDGKDVDTPGYHQTHSCYAVAAFHEALRIILGYGRRRKASDYAYHEKALRQAVEAMGCDVTSNMTSLIVLNLPGKLKGKEKELVQGARAQGFGIWPTLSEPVQVRIGILNQLSPEQIGEITSRFADAMLAMGAEVRQAEGDERAQIVLRQSGLGSALSLGLHVAQSVGHQPGELLGLNAEGLHLRLRVTALQRQDFLHVLGASKIAGQGEGALGVLLGEGDGPFLRCPEAAHLGSARRACPGAHGLGQEIHELAVGRPRLLDILLGHVAQLRRDLERRVVCHGVLSRLAGCIASQARSTIGANLLHFWAARRVFGRNA